MIVLPLFCFSCDIKKANLLQSRSRKRCRAARIALAHLLRYSECNLPRRPVWFLEIGPYHSMRRAKARTFVAGTKLISPLRVRGANRSSFCTGFKQQAAGLRCLDLWKRNACTQSSVKDPIAQLRLVQKPREASRHAPSRASAAFQSLINRMRCSFGWQLRKTCASHSNSKPLWLRALALSYPS